MGEEAEVMADSIRAAGPKSQGEAAETGAAAEIAAVGSTTGSADLGPAAAGTDFRTAEAERADGHPRHDCSRLPAVAGDFHCHHSEAESVSGR